MTSQSPSRWHQAGWAIYAAIMLFGGGLVGIVNGVWAFRYDDESFNLVLAERNLDLWGLAALVIGGIMLAAGIGGFNGAGWARWVGLPCAVAALVWNVAWAEVQPTQSLIGALISLSLIYALATHSFDIDIDIDIEP